MTEFRAQIGRVRMKNGGADVHILHNPMPDNGENWRGKMVDCARVISEYEGDLDGYLVIGLWADGTRSLGFRMTPRIPREMLPSYIAEIIRTDVITEHEAERTFDNRFEWVGS